MCLFVHLSVDEMSRILETCEVTIGCMSTWGTRIGIIWTRRRDWVLTASAAFLLGIGVDRAVSRREPMSAATTRDQTAMEGIERLHKLDERVTLLNDPKALQDEWTNDAVRLDAGTPVDIGKA